MSDAAIATLVTGLVTITTLVCGVVTLWLKIREGNEKLDHNTDLTRAGTLAAAQSASAAVTAAVEVKVATDNIERKLNGGVDAALAASLGPMTTKLLEHTAQDEKNMEEINTRFKDLTEYVHQRNHDILTALQVQTNKIETVLVRLGQLDKEGGAW